MKVISQFHEKEQCVDSDISYLEGDKLQYLKNVSIGYYLEKQARCTPGNVAVRFNDMLFTYAQLYDMVDEQASRLQKEKNINIGDRIAIYFSPSIEMIVAILAVVKIGACYIPLDLSYPYDTIEYIINDATPKLMLTNIRGIEKNFISLEILFLEERYAHKKDYKRKQRKVISLVSGADPVYIMYTSGSTGKPKGVIVPHRAVNNHMLWMKKQFHFSEKDKILLKTPLMFDPSVWEMLLPLYVGAQLVLPSTKIHVDPAELVKVVQKNKITTIQFVPTILNEFLRHPDVTQCHTLQRVFVGGESLSQKTKQIFFEKINCQLINLYGPTEATIDTTFYCVSKDSYFQRNDCIGKPINNCRLYVLDEDKKLCVVGDAGDLYIAGDNLALGYLNNASLTEKNFITDYSDSDKKMYCSGDIVKMLEDGTLEFLGRKDSQLKINGVRIEAEALKNCLLQCAAIQDCFFQKNNDTNGRSFLECFLILSDGYGFLLSEIKSYLEKSFPTCMLPSRYYQLNKVPVGLNGKVSFRNLAKNAILIEEEIENIFFPNNITEKRLEKIWKKILHLKNIASNRDFFKMGGTSLMMLSLLENIRYKFKVDFSLSDVMRFDTIEAQAKEIENKIANQVSNWCVASKSMLSSMNPVICLQACGNATPLYLIHPIGGTIFWYTHLAKKFLNERPIYGIQDPSIDYGHDYFDSIQSMAEFYACSIIKIKQDSPYIIGGASFGATVAVEVAHWLEKHGYPVEIILSFDGWGEYPNELNKEHYFYESMRRQKDEWEVIFGQSEPRYDFNTIFKIQKHRLAILNKYKMQAFSHPMVLFKAADIMPVFMKHNSEDNHWVHYARNLLAVIKVPGSHETMFHELNVYYLGNELKRLFDNIENKNRK
jgi:amino acid adenylation domain-containing protein